MADVWLCEDAAQGTTSADLHCWAGHSGCAPGRPPCGSRRLRNGFRLDCYTCTVCAMRELLSCMHLDTEQSGRRCP